MTDCEQHLGQGPLPEQVKELLQSNGFVHLGTSYKDVPHVSLMNYTFITEGSDYFIFLTTPKNTQKYSNISQNKNVSILVHDWTLTKQQQTPEVSDSNSLLKFLQNLNQNELSQVSATLSGEAQILDSSNPNLDLYKKLHLANNPTAKAFIDGDDIAFVLVKILSSKVADNYNNVDEYI